LWERGLDVELDLKEFRKGQRTEQGQENAVQGQRTISRKHRMKCEFEEGK
jgi:hypothetical protein